jgi:hypothetical protein
MAEQIIGIVNYPATREKMQSALARWQAPRAAEEIAEAMLEAVRRKGKALNKSDGLNRLNQEIAEEETIVGHA